jgi:hypothetical protein
MPTATTAPTTRRVPGWERVLDAFMAAPDRTLTNVELGQIPGVQAFHQRITDLEHLGYVLTKAVQLKPGYYAYALVGRGAAVSVVPAPGGKTRPAPHADVLPIVHERQPIASAVAAAVFSDSEALLKRVAPPAAVAVVGEQAREVRGTRQVRDAVATLHDAIDYGRLSDIDPASREDLLTLAHAARDEMDAARRARKDAADACEAARADVIETLRRAVGPVLVAEHGVTYGEPGFLTDSLVLAQAVRLIARPSAGTATRDAGRRTPERGPTGPQLMRKALEYHEQPMHSSKIAEWVMANGGGACYRGATPAATMAAQLAMSNKQDGEFVKVKPGCYGLREWTGKQDAFGNAILDLDPVR